MVEGGPNFSMSLHHQEATTTHNGLEGGRRRVSTCHGSPMRAAKELRAFREATSADCSHASFPILSSYEQVVGCILESLKSSNISIADFDRGIEAVRNHVSTSRRYSSYDGSRCVEGIYSSSINTTPSQRRDRSYSLNIKPIHLSLEEEEILAPCERKWSMDTATTTLPPSCTNERRLRALVSIPSGSPSVGCSPAPNIPLPPPSPSTFLSTRPRGFSHFYPDSTSASSAGSPFLTPILTSAVSPGSVSPLKFSDITLGDTVGCGSFGVVHRARMNATGKLIAVKVVSVDSRDKSALAHAESLDNELHLLQTLQHPRIVRYLGHERLRYKSGSRSPSCPIDDSDKLIVMCEYMSGGSVANAIRQFGPFDEKAIALHTRQILEV